MSSTFTPSVAGLRIFHHVRRHLPATRSTGAGSLTYLSYVLKVPQRTTTRTKPSSASLRMTRCTVPGATP
jgi:hypothetical protein